MSRMVRWGILSTAGIGEKRVIPAIHKSQNGEVVAVASRALDRAQAFASRNNIPRAYGSYEELLADPEIDAIYIPVPNSQHAEWSIRCAEAGIPTLCEKPLASDADEAQHMVDVFAERGILFAEAFMYRFHPQHDRVRQLIADGAIGEMKMINATFSFRVGDEDNIRLQADLGGGALMDVGCYCINVMRLYTGEVPSRMRALAHFGAKSDVDEIVAAALEFPSGVFGHFDASLRLLKTHQVEVRGTGGRILVPEAFVPYDSPTRILLWQDESAPPQEIEIPDVDQYQVMVEDFADALLNKRAPRYLPQDAVDNMRVIDALRASARAAQADA